jgi:hypothetical protein
MLTKMKGYWLLLVLIRLEKEIYLQMVFVITKDILFCIDASVEIVKNFK